MPVITLDRVTKRFGAVGSVLSELSMTVGTGEYVAIMGESGIGKSTLLNVIAGLEPVDAGSVRFDDVDIAALDDDARTRLRRSRIGFVFQAFHVLPYLNVFQNIALPLELLRQPTATASARVSEMLRRVGLSDRAAAMPRELSGGELQRVALARALVHRPGVVLADEPTGNLDPTSASTVLSLMREEIKSSGASGVIVTHSEAAARTADRILVMRADGLYPRSTSSASP